MQESKECFFEIKKRGGNEVICLLQMMQATLFQTHNDAVDNLFSLNIFSVMRETPKPLLDV